MSVIDPFLILHQKTYDIVISPHRSTVRSLMSSSLWI